MSTLNIKLYDILRSELNITEDKARKITIAIQEVVKEDANQLNTEYKSIFKQDFKDFEIKLDKINDNLLKEISKTEGRIEVKIEQAKSDMLKWFVSFFFAIALMIFSIYLKK